MELLVTRKYMTFGVFLVYIDSLIRNICQQTSVSRFNDSSTARCSAVKRTDTLGAVGGVPGARESAGTMVRARGPSMFACVDSSARAG